MEERGRLSFQSRWRHSQTDDTGGEANCLRENDDELGCGERCSAAFITGKAVPHSALLCPCPDCTFGDNVDSLSLPSAGFRARVKEGSHRGCHPICPLCGTCTFFLSLFRSAYNTLHRKPINLLLLFDRRGSFFITRQFCKQ